MIVVPVENHLVKGVPDYYEVYLNFMKRYEQTSSNECLTLAFHYARVAEEMGQVEIKDDLTLEDDDTEIDDESR